MALIVRIGKKVKAIIRKLFPKQHYMGLVRRIERVKTAQRVVAMTFDDGPCALPPSPDKGDDLSLTEKILEIMRRYDARGTFDVVGDTSENYPDEIGAEGSASWGGIKYDHYPQFECDRFGGAKHKPELIHQILSEGHEISNHSYRHLLFGKKNMIYNKRKTFESLTEVLTDLRRLDALLEERDGYDIKLSRPPHYVDKIKGGFTSYDAYALMQYQYMAASFDGAGWLPCADGYEAEVDEMINPLKAALEADEDALCGQIIFQKDGYNMASRSPVADGLDLQLKLLSEKGYRVVPVSELMEISPFADLGEGDDCFEEAKWLAQHGRCVAFDDNTVRTSKPLTRGEAAMLIAPPSAIIARIIELMKNPKAPDLFKDVKMSDPYSTAIRWCVENDIMQPKGKYFLPDKVMTGEELDSVIARFGGMAKALSQTATHADLIKGVYLALCK